MRESRHFPSSTVPHSESSLEVPGDGLDLIAQSLHAYLQDVHRNRAICRRHENTATVRQDNSILRVTKRFADRPETVRFLLRSAGKLPNWEQFRWPSTSMSVLQRLASKAGVAALGGGSPVYVRGLFCDERPVLLHVYRPPTPELCVEVSLPVLSGDVQELSLTALAKALLCHEYLIPDSVATPLPVDAETMSRFGVQVYLQRTMLKNLYASKCI